ncbi:uncharacterized protein LOC118458019 [Anopheles albimanus]|uniref:uncharacterized protein LOC118458019 n=1 Tax=Anopheles albimanus TaxID=7167 RepID=UPI00163E70A1|nr:uncharacterized protein LOC118458019 [Anopheles albimanus]
MENSSIALERIVQGGLFDIELMQLLQWICRSTQCVEYHLFNLSEVLPVAEHLVTFVCTCFIIKSTDIRSARALTESFPHPFIVIDFAMENLDVLQEAIENGCQSFVLTPSTGVEFMDHFRYVHDRTIARYPSKRVFIVGDPDDTAIEFEDTVRSILNHSVIDDVIDLLLVQPDATRHRVDLFTNGFTPDELTRLDSYDIRSNWRSPNYGVDLFPNKRANLRQRYIRLSVFNYQPYTVWREAETPQEANSYLEHRPTIHIDGTESQLFIEFCASRNCRLEMSLDDVGEWGQIYDNRTGDGILGAVVERRSDIGVGALYSWHHEFGYLSLSKPISRTGVTCIVPKPLPLSSWMTPILPFSPFLWFAVIATFVIATFFDVLVSFGAQKINGKQSTGHVDVCESVMVIMAIFILQTVLLRINKTPIVSQMLLIGSLLLVGLMIGNAYSGGLASVMTVPRFEKSIDTVQDLADRNLRWASTHDAWIFSIQLATQPTIVKLLQNFGTYPKDVLHEHAKRRDMGYSIERLPYGHYAIGEYITDSVIGNFEIMLEDIYWEACVAMATKTWPLMNELDELTLLVFQSGIQQYWESKVVSKYADNKVQHAISISRHFDNPGPIALQPSHLIGAFFLLGFGLACGMICFLVELLWHQWSISRSGGQKRAMNQHKILLRSMEHA